MKNDHGSFFSSCGEKCGLCCPLHHIKSWADPAGFYNRNISDPASSQDSGWEKEGKSQQNQTIYESLSLGAFDPGAFYGDAENFPAVFPVEGIHLCISV